MLCFSRISPPIFPVVCVHRDGCILRRMHIISRFISTLSDSEYSSYFLFSESTHPREQSQVSKCWCRTTFCSIAADKPPLKKTRYIHTALLLALCLLTHILLPCGRSTQFFFIFFFFLYFSAKSLRKLDLSYCNMMVVYREHEAALGNDKGEHGSICQCRASCVSAGTQYRAQGDNHVLHTVGRWAGCFQNLGFGSEGANQSVLKEFPEENQNHSVWESKNPDQRLHKEEKLREECKCQL